MGTRLEQIDWAAIKANLMARFPQLTDMDSKSGSPSDDGPACETCRDAGYLRYDVPPSHENFGKLVACPTCGPQRQRDYEATEAARISQHCGLGDRQRSMTFETFEQYPGNEKAFEAATRFASAGIDRGAWLVIQGKDTGTGKTHLLAAIANAAVKRGVPTLYAYMTELLDHLRAGYNHDGEQANEGGSFEQRWERLKTIRLLLIDDYGVHDEGRPWVRERLEALLDARLRDGLPTAVTTNLTGTDWLRLSDRIRDRFERYEPAAVMQMLALKYRVWKRQQAQQSQQQSEEIPW